MNFDEFLLGNKDLLIEAEDTAADEFNELIEQWDNEAQSTAE